MHFLFNFLYSSFSKIVNLILSNFVDNDIRHGLEIEKKEFKVTKIKKKKPFCSLF